MKCLSKFWRSRKSKDCVHTGHIKKCIPAEVTILNIYELFHLCVCVGVHLCVCYLFIVVWMYAYEYKGKCACICKLWLSTFLCLPSALGLHMNANMPHFHVGSRNSNSYPHVCNAVILGKSYLMGDFNFLCVCEIFLFK